MSRKLIIACLIIILLIFFSYFFDQKVSSSLKSVFVGRTQIMVEIADEEKERATGLSKRSSLGENQGMLFLYKKPGKYTFWMKDMLFPLDFIFIKEGEIVNLATNIPYPKNNEEPFIVNQDKEFDMVLEVNAGFVEKNGIKIGDRVRID